MEGEPRRREREEGIKQFHVGVLCGTVVGAPSPSLRSFGGLAFTACNTWTIGLIYGSGGGNLDISHVNG